MFSGVLPLFRTGKVCRGFGRGSKELGIPTANFDYQVIDSLPDQLDCGIYYGFAKVSGFPACSDNAAVHKAVLSIGWNPYYKNDKKSVETHVLHDFGGDFYGRQLRLVVLGRIRPERDFLSLDELIAEIRNDISIAGSTLESNEWDEFRRHPFFDEEKEDS